MNIDDEKIEVSVVTLAVMCDALHIAQNYMNVDEVKKDLEKNLNDERSFYATVFTIALYMAREELKVLLSTKKDYIEVIRGKEYVLGLIEHYSQLMGEDLRKNNGWSEKDLNDICDQLSMNKTDKDKIEILERMMKAKPYEKN